MSVYEEKQSIFRYYDERAPEYEEIYRGAGPASIPDPQAYWDEVQQIAALLPKYIAGNHIDLACGTGFWIPFYQAKCSQITLIDQSERMLHQCSLKIDRLDIGDKTSLICGDVLSYPFRISQYDSALVGFLFSHLREAEENQLFGVLRKILRPNAKFVIIDSAWNDERRATRKRSGIQKRRLNDGREFEIFKRYFNRKDLIEMARKYTMKLHVIQEGRMSITAVGVLI